MFEILLGVLIPIVIVIAIIVRVVIRGGQMREQCDHGVETVGRIVEKRMVPRRKHAAPQYKLGYCYTDQAGVTHTHTSVVTSTTHAQFEVGSPIAVVYSAQRPDVSAPKTLVDECRRALGK